MRFFFRKLKNEQNPSWQRLKPKRLAVPFCSQLCHHNLAWFSTIPEKTSC